MDPRALEPWKQRQEVWTIAGLVQGRGRHAATSLQGVLWSSVGLLWEPAGWR